VASLSAANLLELWEWGRSVHPIDRGVRLAAVARPDVPGNKVAAMPLGERDASLLALREELFGSDLPCVADCPKCGERLEFDLATANLFQGAPPLAFAELTHAGRKLRLRPLNSLDLAAVAATSNAHEARLRLARRCLLDGDAVDLSDELVDAISERLSEIDQQAEVLLDLTCPICGQAWQRALDVEAYFWREISAEALRLLHQVHTLAHAYGWREADILAMSPTRRQAYVELAS
jgi:hypothetical protein